MEFNLLNITSVIYGFASVILIVFLLSTKSQRPLSNFLLSLYFFISIFDAGSQFLTVYIYSRNPIIGLFISETVFFIIPAFYLFVKSSVYRNFRLSWKSLLHILPFIIVNLIFVPGYYLPLLSGQSNDWIGLIYDGYLGTIVYVLIHAQILIYFFFIFRLIFRYKKLLLENYSNPKLDNYKWLVQLATIFFISDIISMVKNIFRFSSGETLYEYSINMVALIAVIIIFWLIIKALKKPEIFSGIYSDLQLVKNMVSSEPKMNILSNEKGISNPIIKKLLEHMEEHEPFLNSSLSMHDLAKQLNVPVRELSVAINHNLNKHFFDFVNEYRIAKAMDIFKNSDDKKLTVLEVLYEVGFNSKSSFNTAFKKHTGLTPTEFRKKATLSVA